MDVEKKISKVLQKVAVDHKFGDYEIDIKPFSSGGANYSSTLYNATIRENTNVHHLFVKVAALGEKIRSEGPNAYAIEMFTYTKLIKVYEYMQNKYKVPEEHRLRLSKFYGCDATVYEETIVLENLVMKGYQAFDRFKSIDWEYASSTLTELAKMHAPSFAYSEYYPEDFKELLNFCKFEWGKEDGLMIEFFKQSSDIAINTVEGETKDKLIRFFEEFGMHNFKKFFCTTRRQVLVHGDFRPSNFMHKVNDDGTVDVKICDLQTLQGGSPVVDIIYFIFTGSDEKFREQYYDKLLDHYYTELHAAMKRLDLDPDNMYSREDFAKDLREKLPFGLTIAVFGLPIITVAAEDAPKISEDLDFSSLAENRPSDLYVERLNGVINDYIKFGILK